MVAYKKGAQHNTDGTLGGSFGSGGVITPTSTASATSATTWTIDSQGRIVAVGTSGDGFALMRANP